MTEPVAHAVWLRIVHRQTSRTMPAALLPPQDLLGPSPAEAGRLDVEMADDDDAGPLTTGAERNGVLGKRAGREDWQSGVGGIDKAWMLKQARERERLCMTHGTCSCEAAERSVEACDAQRLAVPGCMGWCSTQVCTVHARRSPCPPPCLPLRSPVIGPWCVS